MLLDGVTQYQLHWQKSPLATSTALDALNHWRTRFHDLNVIGQDPNRYGGVGFGNLSCRLNDHEFLVTGTQTGHLRTLTPDHYSHIIACDPHANNVHAKGPTAPSSEAMTHYMIYQCVPTAHFIIHLHAPTLWHKATTLNIPVTPPDVGYGTPAMADAVAEIIAKQAQNAASASANDTKENGRFESTQHIIAMGGHEDGIIAWGPTLDPLGEELVSLLIRAEKD